MIINIGDLGNCKNCSIHFSYLNGDEKTLKMDLFSATGVFLMPLTTNGKGVDINEDAVETKVIYLLNHKYTDDIIGKLFDLDIVMGGIHTDDVRTPEGRYVFLTQPEFEVKNQIAII